MSTTSVLEALLPETRRRILVELVRSEHNPPHIRELSRRIGLDISGVRRECGSLESAGILCRRNAGNLLIFYLNPSSPIYGEIKLLVVKTEGVADCVRNELLKTKLPIELAFIYGSFASGAFNNESDVDLVIVTNAPVEDFSDALSAAEKTIGREVNAAFYSPEEYRRELLSKSSFASVISSGQIVWLIGVNDES